jgi:hypothetical protein
MKTLFAVLICVAVSSVAQEPIKSRCLSSICLGDDLVKLSGMKLPWLDPEEVHKDFEAKHLGGVKYHRQPERIAPDWITRNYRGVTPEQRALLISAFMVGASDGSFYEYGGPARDLLPPPLNQGAAATPYITASQSTIDTLKGVTVCAGLPVLGVIKSESYTTSVFLWPENGRLVVVRLSRAWVTNVPKDAISSQQIKMTNDQIMDLSTQIGQTYYSGTWKRDGTNARASDSETVAYFAVRQTWGNQPVPEVILTLYTKSFAAYQGNEAPPIQRVGNMPVRVPIVKNPMMDVDIQFGLANQDAEAFGAKLPACTVSATRLPVN